MNISELVEKLEDLKREHGDLPMYLTAGCELEPQTLKRVDTGYKDDPKQVDGIILRG